MGVFRLRGDVALLCCALFFWSGHHVHTNVALHAAPAHHALRPPRPEPCPAPSCPELAPCAAPAPCQAVPARGVRGGDASAARKVAAASIPRQLVGAGGGRRRGRTSGSRRARGAGAPAAGQRPCDCTSAAALAHKKAPAGFNATGDVAVELAARAAWTSASSSRRRKDFASPSSNPTASPSCVVPRVKLEGEPNATTVRFASKYETSVFGATPPKAVAKSAAIAGAPTSALLLGLLADVGAVVGALAPVLAKVPRGPVVALAVNRGVLDIVANFLCSEAQRRRPVATTSSFAADEATAAALDGAVAATFSPALGDFPERPAHKYGDSVFVSMMWLKVVAVYLVNRCGRDVLFMDADVVWQADPLPLLAAYGEDTLWMDDVARSNRYVPYSANTGFYLVRANRRTAHFLFAMLTHFDLIIVWRSHQHVLNALLQEHASRMNLGVRVLPRDDFQIGAIFHRNKTYADELARGVARPAVFHWAWTEGRDDKLRLRGEHVARPRLARRASPLASGAKLLADCCLRPEPGPLRDFAATPPPAR
ncbi:nucleotide-diphospho-sugar transferase [Aureococcus anophagefferens]|nr:nucleotide-diphospho-sugar transferase [Aureococcus anophagefferens]